MKKPKVFLIHNFFMDYRVPLFEELDKKFDITFLMSRETQKTDSSFYQLDYRKTPSHLKYKLFSHSTYFSKYSISWKLMHHLLFNKYDVVISTDQHVFETYLGFLISKIKRKKFIVWSETFDWPRTPSSKFLNPLVRMVSSYSDACVAAGTQAKKYFVKMGAKPKNVFIAPDSTLNYEIKEKNAKLEKELKGKKVILYLSRIVPYKGVDYLIKAFSKLEREKDDVYLLIGGAGSFKEEMKKLAMNLKIKNIRFLGKVNKEQIGFYYSLCDLFVLPSTFRDYDAECWGLVLNEVMAFGKPLISTTATGAAYDVIKNGVNGFRVKHGSSEEIYEAMKTVLSNEKLMKKMGKESRKMIDERFNYDQMADGFRKAIYASLT